MKNKNLEAFKNVTTISFGPRFVDLVLFFFYHQGLPKVI